MHGSIGVAAIRPKVYGMLYAPENAEQHVNLDAVDPVTIYVQNAVTLAQSALSSGVEFRLVTNDAERLMRVARMVPGHEALELLPFDFRMEVPRGINFQSAHYKLELLQAFGTGAFGEYCAMVDIDAVLLRPIELPDPDSIYFYDISPQHFGLSVPAKAQADLDMVSGESIANPRWFGGEFKAGPAHLFKALGDEIADMWPRYQDVARQMYHTGEEMVLSAAVNRMIQKGLPVRDAGAEHMVARWWSLSTRNRIGSWQDAARCAVFHVPACKQFLARDFYPFDSNRFLAAHRRWSRGRLPREVVKVVSGRLRGQRTYLPRVL